MISSIRNCLLFLSILLIPFQIGALPVRSTSVDISVLLFTSYLILSLRRNALIVFSLLLFGFISLSFLSTFLWEISYPVARIAAPAFFFSMMLALYINTRDVVAPSIKVICSAINGAIVLSLFSAFVFLSGSFSGLDRGGFFNESSFASLFYCSSLGYLLTRLSFRFTNSFSYANTVSSLKSFLIAFCIFLFPGVHPLTLFLTFLVVYVRFIYRKISVFLLRFKVRILSLVFIIAVFLTALFVFSNNDNVLFTHITSRLEGFQQGDNLSALVYMSGYYQLKSSLSVCPLTGCGLGSPGYAGIDIYSYVRSISSVPFYIELASALNKHDLYSLLFRGIFELGPLLGVTLPLLILCRFYKKIILVLNNISPSLRINNPSMLFQSHQAIDLLSILTWCLTHYIGSLLKEPHLFRSHVFTPLMLGLIVSGSIHNLQIMNSSIVKTSSTPLKQ